MVDVMPVCRPMAALFSPVLNFESMPTIEGVSFSNLIFLCAGSQDGSLCIWDIENPSMDNKPIKILKTEQTPLSCFGFNPKYTMMVTGHEQVVSTAYVCDLTFQSPTTISSPVLGQVFEHWF